jgi:DNA-binding IclR family transcriptional regulator
MSESYPGTQSLLRAIRLLKLFGGEQAVWSLNELVRATELNKTTVFRMLTALESEGLVARTPNGHYQLGVEMVALGGRAMLHNPLRQVAQPLLERLVNETGERTTLEQPVINPDGTYAMLVLIEIQGRHLISINQFIGSRLPMHATSTGKAYLASMAEEERTRVLQQHFACLTQNTITNVAQLQDEFAQIRARGYAIALGELEVGLMAAGTVVRNHTGAPVATVSIEGPDTRINESKLHELGREIVKVAEEISFRLGYRG